MNSTNNLDEVAIIDLRGPDPGAFHDAYRSWAIRARLEREHGTYANHVIWFGAVPLMGDPNYATEGLLAMDRWLAAVETDDGTGTLAQKIIRDRPADVNDRCSQIAGLELVSLPGVGTICELKDVQTRYGTPRTVAGEGIETDINKCTLKPLRRLDYYPIDVHRRPVAAPRGGVPDRRLRLEQARGRPGGHDPVADLPGRERQRGLRRPAARAPRRRARAAAGRAPRSPPGAGKGPPFAQRFSASSVSEAIMRANVRASALSSPAGSWYWSNPISASCSIDPNSSGEESQIDRHQSTSID